MGRAKEIQIRVIPSKIANPFIRAHHYSGKVVNNSCLHFGAFLDGRLHGVLSYGPSLDKKKIIGLVEGTTWDGFLELNRMAFDDYLPRNSESYCIAKTIRLIRKQAPQVKWIISFADGCSCGDGTIYRACNFVLTDIKRNDALCLLPNGDKIHKMTLHSNPTSPRPELGGRTFYEVTGGKYDWDAYVKEVGGTILPGYQLRYIYFIDPEYRKRLKVPEIPFSRIDELGAGMYKGQQVFSGFARRFPLRSYPEPGRCSRYDYPLHPLSCKGVRHGHPARNPHCSGTAFLCNLGIYRDPGGRPDCRYSRDVHDRRRNRQRPGSRRA